MLGSCFSAFPVEAGRIVRIWLFASTVIFKKPQKTRPFGRVLIKLAVFVYLNIYLSFIYVAKASFYHYQVPAQHCLSFLR